MTSLARAAGSLPTPILAATAQTAFALPERFQRWLVGPPISIDGSTLSLQMQVLLKLTRAQGASTGLIQHRRGLQGADDYLDKSSAAVSGRVGRTVNVRNVTVGGADGQLAARLYEPIGAPNWGPLVVFFHGGGYVVGSLDSHDPPCKFLAEDTGFRVLSIDYRLAPEFTFPAAADDAIAAFEWVVGHAQQLGADPSAIAVAGDSAGGGLAAIVAQQLSASGGPAPVASLLFYPVVAGREDSRSRNLFADGYYLTKENIEWFVEQYVPDVADETNPKANPIVATELAAIPRTHIVTAGFDPLRDEGEEYAAKLEAAGVAVTQTRESDLIHGFINFVGVSSRSREALSDAAKSLREHLTAAIHA